MVVYVFQISSDRADAELNAVRSRICQMKATEGGTTKESELDEGQKRSLSEIKIEKAV